MAPVRRAATRLAIVLILTLATFSAGSLPANADETTDTDRAAAASALSASRPSATVVTAGKKVTIRGTVSGGARTLAVQFRIGRDWLTVAKTTSNASGEYTAQVPTYWYGSHDVRINAAPTAAYRAVASSARQITIRPNYTPRGSRRAFRVSGVRWNPCAVINVKVNLSGAPSGAMTTVKRAFGKVRAATGLRFRFVGSTNKVPFATGSNFEAETIIIAFTTPSRVHYLRGSALGVGGAVTTRHTEDGVTHRRYSAGGVAVDRTDYRRLRTGFGRGITQGAVLIHEIGHTLGVEHINDNSQVMNPYLHPNSVGRFGAGDLAGLRAVGASKGCVSF